MGIPGLLKEIGKGDRIALAKLAIDHFETHKRPLRIAIDAAIWNFQTQLGGQGGKNPALRTLFFRLLRLLALPIHPVFVYDGKNKPLTKRGKTVSRYGTCVPAELSKKLVARFCFPHHTAPGEAEAECAVLQRCGIVDTVMTQDVDAIIFGSGLTLRDWSREGTKGNKAPTHVSVLDSKQIKEVTGLDTAGMILVALFSGGDYHEGVAGFGPALSCSIARAGFGEDLLELVKADDGAGLQEWRERLQYELETNESGYFAKRHKTVKVPADFPDRNILNLYLKPAVSGEEEMKKLEKRWLQWWDKEIDVPALREYCGMTFDWLYKGGAVKFTRCMAQPLFQHRLKTIKLDQDNYTLKDVGDKRTHFETGGVTELRFSAVPTDVVGIDISAEEENPEFAELEADPEDELEVVDDAAPPPSSQEPSSPLKKRQRPPWSPFTVERWWVPKPLLVIGLLAVMKEYEAEQMRIRDNPVAFATRKARIGPPKPSKKIDHNMKEGALNRFFGVTKTASIPTTAAEEEKGEPDQAGPPQARQRAPLARTRSNPVVMSSPSRSQIGDFFKATKRKSDEVASPEGKKKSFLGSLLDDVDDMVKEVPPPRMKQPFSRSKTVPAILSTDESDHIDGFELPVTVTQRKKRSKVALSDNPPDSPTSAPDSPSIPAPIGARLTSKHVVVEDDGDLPLLQAAPEEHEVVLRLPRRSRSPDARQPEKTPVAQIKLGLRKHAASRDSLPGAWREIGLTPSQRTKIAFIDLTDD